MQYITKKYVFLDKNCSDSRLCIHVDGNNSIIIRNKIPYFRKHFLICLKFIYLVRSCNFKIMLFWKKKTLLTVAVNSGLLSRLQHLSWKSRLRYYFPASTITFLIRSAYAWSCSCITSLYHKFVSILCICRGSQGLLTSKFHISRHDFHVKFSD